MNAHDLEITDADLLLFLYRDGLEPARLAEIECVLMCDEALAHRCAELRRTLAAAELEQSPEPAAGFSQRLWQQLQPRLAAERDQPQPALTGNAGRPSQRQARRRRTALGFVAGMAASLLLAVGFLAGRHSGIETAPTAASGAERIYASVLLQHLGASSRSLSVAVNGGGNSIVEGNAQLAYELLQNNRLYLATAMRQGDRRMVELLQRLEPVLIELANPKRADDIQLRTGLGDFVERSDLIFEVRAAETGLRARQPLSA